MDFFETVKTRHSVRKYKPDIPSVEDLKKIIDAARLAPSSTNSQMWHFKVIYNKNLKDNIRQVIINKFDEMANWAEAKEYESKIAFMKHFATFFTDAPVNIAVITTPRETPMIEMLKKRGLSKDKIEKLRPNGVLLSIGAAVENLLLAANDLGYGTCWLTAPLYACDELEKLLEVKQDEALVSFISLGVPDEQTQGPQKKNLEEIMTIIE